MDEEESSQQPVTMQRDVCDRKGRRAQGPARGRECAAKRASRRSVLNQTPKLELVKRTEGILDRTPWTSAEGQEGVPVGRGMAAV